MDFFVWQGFWNYLKRVSKDKSRLTVEKGFPQVSFSNRRAFWSNKEVPSPDVINLSSRYLAGKKWRIAHKTLAHVGNFFILIIICNSCVGNRRGKRAIQQRRLWCVVSWRRRKKTYSYHPLLLGSFEQKHTEDSYKTGKNLSIPTWMKVIFQYFIPAQETKLWPRRNFPTEWSKRTKWRHIIGADSAPLSISFNLLCSNVWFFSLST